MLNHSVCIEIVYSFFLLRAEKCFNHELIQKRREGTLHRLVLRMASHSSLVQSVVALILFVAMAFASADNAGSTVDVIQAITKSIEGRKDLMSVRRYLGWSTNLHLDFPVTGFHNRANII